MTLPRSGSAQRGLFGGRLLQSKGARPRTGVRRCFVHIGTHKTGTTSLQVTLNSHRSDLEARQYLYPVTGRPPEAPDGHHNIAWEISGDARFDARHGTIDTLVTEIRGVAHSVIISSEDFECSVHHPERFTEFIRRLQACGLAVTIVVYFRNQVDYSQSLYLTMLRYGLPKSFNAFLDEIVDTGRLHWQGWIIPFCYKDLVARLKATRGLDILVRSYDSPKRGTLVEDFLSIFGLKSLELGVDAGIQTNTRDDLISSVRLFYGNRKNAPLDEIHEQVVSALFEPLKHRPINTSGWSKRRLVERFGNSIYGSWPNKGRAERSGPTHPSMHPVRVDDTLWMETVFSTELEQQIDALASVCRTNVGL